MTEYQAVDLGGFPVTETTPVVAGPSGRGIVSIVRTSGDGSPGTDDTYTITYTYGSPSTFVVHNGSDGESVGAVASVNGDTGVVVLSAADVGADASGAAATAQAAAIAAAASDATTKANAAKSGAEATAAGALASHEADTTSVHGIANTALLETTSGAQSKADAAQAAAELTASDADNLTSGLVAQARLGSGSAGAGAKFLADDQTYKTIGGGGDMLASVYDPTTVEGDAFDRALHHGDVPAANVDGLATVATTGAYGDLSGKPTLGTAAAAATGDFATAAQGVKADSALQAAAIGTTVQAHDGDLDAIAGLSPTNDDVLQRKAGSWVNRTMAQLKVDLAITVASISDFVSSVASAITTERTAVAAYTNKDLTAGTNTFPTFNQNTTGSAATLTTSRTIGTLTGDVTSAGSGFNGSANNTNAATLATVNSNVGSFGSATAVSTFTVDGKGRLTAAGSTTIAIPASAVTDFSTAADARVAAAAATGTGNLVRATSPTLVTPALGTPTALTLTNATGLPAAGIGSGTIATARLGSGTASASTFLAGDQAYKTVPGQILGFVSFDNSGTYVTRTSTNEVWSVIDASATATITAPASGNLLVTVSVCAQAMDINGCYLGVVNAAGTLYAGTAAELTGAGTIQGGRITHTAVISGLTPGNSYTLRPGFAGTPDGNITVEINVPDPVSNEKGGPVVMSIAVLP